jgi:hypothetical protein
MPFDYAPTSKQSQLSTLPFTILDVDGKESWMNLGQLHRLFKVYEGYVSIWECAMNQKTYVYFQTPDAARKAASELNQKTSLNLISGEAVCLNYHTCSSKSQYCTAAAPTVLSNYDQPTQMALVKAQPIVTHPPEPSPVRYINNTNVLQVCFPNMKANHQEKIMSLPGVIKMELVHDNEYRIEFDRCSVAKEAKETVETIIKLPGDRNIQVELKEASTIQVREIMPSEQASQGTSFVLNTGEISVTNEKISLSLDNDHPFTTLKVKVDKVFQELAGKTSDSIDPQFLNTVTQLIQDVFQHEKGHCLILNE